MNAEGAAGKVPLLVAASLALALAAAGCLSPHSVACGDGRFCPTGTDCDVVGHTCISPSEKMACANLAEGDTCILNMLPGACHGGGCRPFYCGDGVRTAGEACEGNDLGGQTCADLHFYGQTSGLACNSDCTLNTTGCTGLCGDGVVNGSEQCDGSPSTLQSCIPFGYDQGFVGCSDNCQHTFEGCAKYGGWGVVATSTTAAGGFRAVWGSGADDVYAVGGPTVLHWNGGEWSATTRAIDPGLSPTLFGVWGSGPSDVFAVGQSVSGPTAFHWDGARWTAQTLPGTLNAGLGVWGSGPNDVYVVSDSVIHWDGTRWSSVGALSALAVWGSGPSDVFAVSLKHELFHWEGSIWLPMGAPPQPYTRVWGSGPKDVYAVGGQQISHWDGATWSMIDAGASGPVLGISGTGPKDVMAVGRDLLGWDGTRWTKDASLRSWSLMDVWVDKGGAIFAVGTDAGLPTVIARSQNAWGTSGFDGTPPVLNAVWGAGTEELFAVGEGGTLAHWDGSAWSTTALDPTLPIRAVWGNGPNDVLAVGDNKIDDPVVNLAHWDGARWSRPSVLPTISPPGSMRGVWSSGPNDAYLVGESNSNGLVFHWNGTAWSALDSVFRSPTGDPPVPDPNLGPPLSTVWGSNSNDVFVFGYGYGTHFDGVQWSGVGGGSGSVWGSSAHDVYVVGGPGPAAGEVGHWDGTRWTYETPTFQGLLAVGGSTAGDVFVAGDNLLLHRRAGGWEQIALPVTGSIHGLWVTPSRVTLVGTMGEIHLDRASVTCVGPERDCNDGWDNDCDGLADIDDPDCAGKVAEQCANGVDDDGDGAVDCADPDCVTFPACKVH